jgi:hypothetical protein
VAAVYVPRSPTTGVLYGVVRAHLTHLLAAVDAETDGAGLPGFVVNEFRKFLRCGVLSHGFARVRCGDCGFDRLVLFSPLEGDSDPPIEQPAPPLRTLSSIQ